jgi:Bifunctional DNA primase/polymerase, N-terminal
MNRLIARDQLDQLKEGLRRINSIYPDLPLVPLNGSKQPLGSRWQDRPLRAAELIDAIDNGGVEVSSSGRLKKIQPQGFGVLTGRPLTLDGQTYYLMALDQDGTAAAQKILSLSNNKSLPPTVAFTSGRSGRCQYLFLVPENYEKAIKTKKIKTGTLGDDGKEELLEFRWKNLQSVLPPSVHPTTGEYRWVSGCAIDEIEIAPAPTWVIEQMSVGEPRRTVQPLKRSPHKPILPVSLYSSSQQPRHPEQIQIPVPSAVPLEICCRTQVRDWIASGVQKGSGRNDTAIAVGLELIAVERYLQSLGQPVEFGARQLFSEYCQRSGMTDREEEERWRWCESKEPTPSCSFEGITACLRGWYWREHVKPLQNSQITHDGLTIKEPMDYERGSANAERTLDSTSEQRTSPLPITNSQPLEPETMLPEKDKMDARHIGENMQQIPQQTTLIAARLVKTIFEQIRKNPALQKDLAVDITKPASVSINVDGKVAYKGIEGKQPSINSVEPEAGLFHSGW